MNIAVRVTLAAVGGVALLWLLVRLRLALAVSLPLLLGGCGAGWFACVTANSCRWM